MQGLSGPGEPGELVQAGKQTVHKVAGDESGLHGDRGKRSLAIAEDPAYLRAGHDLNGASIRVDVDQDTARGPDQICMQALGVSAHIAG